MTTIEKYPKETIEKLESDLEMLKTMFLTNKQERPETTKWIELWTIAEDFLFLSNGWTRQEYTQAKIESFQKKEEFKDYSEFKKLLETTSVQNDKICNDTKEFLKTRFFFTVFGVVVNHPVILDKTNLPWSLQKVKTAKNKFKMNVWTNERVGKYPIYSQRYLSKDSKSLCLFKMRTGEYLILSCKDESSENKE
jgi:hypothetical protein